ncbi:MAG: hypothetical protein CM15mP83_2940 [Flavobacteriaceae bacterium]|nr:MAG: hypothetical protein CM15mP83_2940 [Flavobacteriaceae bacterium]
MNHASEICQVFDSIVYKKHLPTSLQFIDNRIPNEGFTKANNLTFYGCLFGGGVLIIDKSRAAIKLNCSVLGIGVAVSVSTSTLALSALSFSFTLTPNFCSSSTIS